MITLDNSPPVLINTDFKKAAIPNIRMCMCAYLIHHKQHHTIHRWQSALILRRQPFRLYTCVCVCVCVCACVWLNHKQYCSATHTWKPSKTGRQSDHLKWMCLGRSEVLRSSRHYLWAQSRGHRTIDRLDERSMERVSTRWSSLEGRGIRDGHRQSDKHWNCFKGNTGETFSST